MLCLRCSRGASVLSGLSKGVKTSSTTPAKRTFTSLTPLRPTVLPRSSTSSFQPTLSNSAFSSNPETRVLGDIAILPFKPTTHPALASLQIRCGPRNTFNPSHFVRKRRHGFLSRVKTRTGRMILRRRRAKGRKNLSH